MAAQEKRNLEESPMSAAISSARREVHYKNLDEFRADVERLAETTVRTVGKWTYPQILDHLARSMTASLDGYGFKAPWLARVLIAPLVKNSILTKGIRPGFSLPKAGQHLFPSNDLDLSTAVENMHKALARYEAEPQRVPHPFFGPLASQEYTSFHLRHSELHMSFVVPDETA
jgi:hypothetical protein